MKKNYAPGAIPELEEAMIRVVEQETMRHEKPVKPAPLGKIVKLPQKS